MISKMDLGTNTAKDFSLGQRLVQRLDYGDTTVFDPYTTLTGTLPLPFNSRIAGALKDYRVYGTASGSGVETENLVENIINGANISSSGTVSNSTDFSVGYGKVEQGETYTAIADVDNRSFVLAFYYSEPSLGSQSYNAERIVEANTKTYSFTAPITGYVAFRAGVDFIQHMLVSGSTAPDHYIPYGYKIPILNTSGVTENKFDKNEITEDYYINADGEMLPYNSFGCSDPIPVSSGNYTISNIMMGISGGWSFRIHGYDANGNWVRQIKAIAVNNASMSSTFTVDSDITDIRVSIKIRNGQDLDVLMITPGDIAPDHYIPHRYQSNYDLMIGSTKLGATEYLDFAEQKIYKDVSGTLTPTDPPAPLPAINAYQGENTLSSTEAVGNVTVKGRIRPYVYGFKIDQSISDPATAVTYLRDAIGKTPAAMGSTAFSYGDWEDVFFMPKPCMLKSNGTVDYYLDQDDYSKKVDGTASDISDLSYDGNAMMEWPLIYYKFEEDSDGNVYFYCSAQQVDDSYHCWCNYDASNNVIPHFYTAIYNGIIRSNKMRSLSGYRLTPAIGTIPAYDDTATYTVGSICKVSTTAYTCITPVTEAEPFDSSKWQEITPNNNGGTTGQTEVNGATANNPANTTAWYTDVYIDRQLISALLILMGKSRNDQGVFGRGLDSGSQAAKQAYVTGTLDNKGLFWGVTANGNSAVKVFGMENWYGCVWRRTAGLIGVTVDGVNKYAYKLTYGTADGSTAAAYGSSATGYLIADGRPASSNWVKTMSGGKHGLLPNEVSSSSSYYTVYYYTGTGYALFGGASPYGLYVGSLYVSLASGFSYAYWTISGSLSCKPQKQ